MAPYINKLKKRKAQPNPHGKSAQIWTNIYNTGRWRKLRHSKLMDQPLCELCLEEGRVTAAEDVHHRVEIGTYDDLERQKMLAFDYNNLISICHHCHMKLHGEKHKNNNDYNEKSI